MQEAAWKLQKEEEERKAAEAAAAALAAKEEADQRKAEDVVGELKREYAAWQKGAAKQELGRWRMLPAVSAVGGWGAAGCGLRAECSGRQVWHPAGMGEREGGSCGGVVEPA